MRSHTLLLSSILALGAISSVPASAADAPPLDATTRDYDQIHLDLVLDVDIPAGRIEGTATHQLASLVDGLSVVRMHLEDMEVKAVRTVEGAACEVEHTKKVLSIRLDRPRKEGERFGLVIEYGGKPRSGMWFFAPSEEAPGMPLQIWTQGQANENRHWIPCYDLPDDRLTTSLTVTVPAGLTTLSNGRPGDTVAAGPGRTTHTWSLGDPHPSYLITLVAGTFDVVRREAAGVEQYDYVAPGWGEWADEVFGRTPDMMGFFQDYTGQPYPWGRYSQVTVWDFQYGGMENTGATTLNMRALHRDGIRPDYSADGLVAHELAHMWFGDLITCRTWNHIWLNEGFATYFTDLWREHAQGADEFAISRLGSRDAYLDGVNLARLSSTPRPASPTGCGDIDGKQYVKGSSVLHMIRNMVGDDAFRRGIRRYVREARQRSVESEVLRAALEAESGQDLWTVFEQWVYGSGYPVLAVSGEWDAEQKALVLRVRQTQPATPEMPHFRMPVDVEIVWPDGTREKRRHEVSRAAHEWRVQGPGAPTNWRVDPDTWLVAKVQETKPRKMWIAQLEGDPRGTGRILAARALGGMGVAAVPALAKAAGSDAGHHVRAEACEALGKIGGRAAAAGLVEAAQDADSRVRRAALSALGGLPAAWSAPTLLAHLDDERDYVAAAAVAALGKTRAPGAFDAIAGALDRDSHRNVVREQAMNALKSLGDPRGAALARRYLPYAWGQGVQHRLRSAALDAMVALAPNDPATRRAVLERLRDPYFRMKRWAAGHAAALGMEEAVPVLEELEKSALGPGVTGAMKSALAKLRAAPPKDEDEEAAEDD